MRVDNLEKKIFNVEGFDVRVLENGIDKKGNSEEARSYTFMRASQDSRTVAQWIDERFKETNPHFEVEVLDGDGNIVHGRTTLGNVRETYF